MANGDLVPENLEFQQEEFDPAVTPQTFEESPSDLEYDLMLQKFSDSVNSLVYPSNYNALDSERSGPTGPNYNPYE